MNLKQTASEEWKEVGQLLSQIAKDIPSGAADSLRSKCAEMMVAEVVADDDEDAEELCNCQFTLAYGMSLNTSLLHGLFACGRIYHASRWPAIAYKYSGDFSPVWVVAVVSNASLGNNWRAK